MNEQMNDTELKPVFPELDVSDEGAWVTELKDAEGRPVLFGKREINDKNRGGMHVCLPNFGPDKSGVFKQHGFGRDVAWERDSTDEDGLKFTLRHPEGLVDAFKEYGRMCAVLRYQVGENQLDTTLTVRNDSQDSQNKLPLSPGFHPYFAVGENEDVALNGAPIVLNDYSTAQCIEGSTMTLVIGGRTLSLSSKELNKWFVWTEGDDFICVEPTLDGGDFDSTNPPHVLAPGEMDTFSFAILWTD